MKKLSHQKLSSSLISKDNDNASHLEEPSQLSTTDPLVKKNSTEIIKEKEENSQFSSFMPINNSSSVSVSSFSSSVSSTSGSFSTLESTMNKNILSVLDNQSSFSSKVSSSSNKKIRTIKPNVFLATESIMEADGTLKRCNELSAKQSKLRLQQQSHHFSSNAKKKKDGKDVICDVDDKKLCSNNINILLPPIASSSQVSPSKVNNSMDKYFSRISAFAMNSLDNDTSSLNSLDGNSKAVKLFFDEIEDDIGLGKLLKSSKTSESQEKQLQEDALFSSDKKNDNFNKIISVTTYDVNKNYNENDDVDVYMAKNRKKLSICTPPKVLITLAPNEANVQKVKHNVDVDENSKTRCDVSSSNFSNIVLSGKNAMTSSESTSLSCRSSTSSLLTNLLKKSGSGITPASGASPERNITITSVSIIPGTGAKVTIGSPFPPLDSIVQKENFDEKVTRRGMYNKNCDPGAPLSQERRNDQLHPSIYNALTSSKVVTGFDKYVGMPVTLAARNNEGKMTRVPHFYPHLGLDEKGCQVDEKKIKGLTKDQDDLTIKDSDKSISHARLKDGSINTALSKCSLRNVKATLPAYNKNNYYDGKNDIVEELHNKDHKGHQSYYYARKYDNYIKDICEKYVLTPEEEEEEENNERKENGLDDIRKPSLANTSSSSSSVGNAACSHAQSYYSSTCYPTHRSASRSASNASLMSREIEDNSHLNYLNHPLHQQPSDGLYAHAQREETFDDVVSNPSSVAAKAAAFSFYAGNRAANHPSLDCGAYYDKVFIFARNGEVQPLPEVIQRQQDAAISSEITKQQEQIQQLAQKNKWASVVQSLFRMRVERKRYLMHRTQLLQSLTHVLSLQRNRAAIIVQRNFRMFFARFKFVSRMLNLWKKITNTASSAVSAAITAAEQQLIQLQHPDSIVKPNVTKIKRSSVSAMTLAKRGTKSSKPGKKDMNSDNEAATKRKKNDEMILIERINKLKQEQMIIEDIIANKTWQKGLFDFRNSVFVAATRSFLNGDIEEAKHAYMSISALTNTGGYSKKKKKPTYSSSEKKTDTTATSLSSGGSNRHSIFGIYTAFAFLASAVSSFTTPNDLAVAARMVDIIKKLIEINELKTSAAIATKTALASAATIVAANFRAA